MQILLANAVLSIFASGVQLFQSYDQGRAEVYDTVRQIEDSFRTSFEDALWTFNFGIIDALLDGVVSKPEVAYLRLSSDNGQVWERGTVPRSDTVLRDVNLVHRGQVFEKIGTLQIAVSLAHVQDRLWSQALTLLASNFLKTVCASIIMLFLVDRYLTRHLVHIANHVARPTWLDAKNPLRLDRDRPSEGDELDQIVQAINTAQFRGVADIVDLSREVDRRRQVETSLRQRGRALRAANREQAEFSYALSHDMKSPVNTVWMLLDELQRDKAEALGEDGLEILQDAQRTNKRMAKLIEDVLKYSSTVNATLALAPVDLNDVLKDVIEDLRADIRGAQAKVTYSDLPTIKGDATQLRMLFLNLVQNSIKFRDAARTPEIKIETHPSANMDQVQVRVIDNGIGIDPIFQTKVFGLFQRLHSHSTYPGSGIGLSVCKRIITNHAGQVAVMSQPGNGCTFVMQFPKGDTDE